MIHRVFTGIAIVFVSVGTSLSVSAYNGDPELLLLLQNARKDSMERITTWRGRAALDKATAHDNGTLEIGSVEEAEFAYDRNLNTLRWNLVVHERVYEKQGPSVSPSNPEHYGALLKGDLFYRHDPNLVELDGTVKNTLVIFPRDQQRINGFASDFDPMWYFTRAGYDVDKFLAFHYENRDKPNFNVSGKSIAREGDLVTWETGGSDIVNRWVFDLSKGGSLVRFEGKDPHADVQYDWGYEQINDVWVPSTFEFKNRQIDSAGEARRELRKVVFTNNEINVSLADDEFTLERLGVKPGTRVTDTVLGVAYLYGDDVVSHIGLPVIDPTETALEQVAEDIQKILQETPASVAENKHEAPAPVTVPSPGKSYSVPLVVSIGILVLLASFVGYRAARGLRKR